MAKETTGRLRALGARQGLTEQVYDAIIDLLLDGEIDEGSPIRIDHLASVLGVSATPVREALARLESTGLVVRENYKGYRTASRLTVGELQDLMLVRKLLEPEATYLACTHRAADVLPELESAVEAQEQAHSAGGPSEFNRFMHADQQFHRLIHDATGNRFLAAAANALGGNVQRWRQFENRVIADAEESLEEHRQILEAFRTGDPENARAAMQTHLDNLARRMQLA